MIPQHYPATPIQQLNYPLPGGNVAYIKRDDLLPFSFGGNKVRIAEAFLADMAARGYTGLVMYGDLRSNLCRVLAMRCAQERIPAIMIATAAGEDAEESSFNTQLIRSFDIPLMICEPHEIADTVDTACSQLRAKGLEPYYIYGNRYGTGNEGTAAQAYAPVWQEICTQETAMGVRFDRVVIPYGTGGTQGGLIAGKLVAGDDRPIDGISISSRSPERAASVLASVVTGYFSKNGQQVPSGWERAIRLHCQYNCGAYGAYNEEITSMIDGVLATDGIPLDPTYTGKAFCGLMHLIEDAGITGEHILFVHTGGLPLFFDYLNQRS